MHSTPHKKVDDTGNNTVGLPVSGLFHKRLVSINSFEHNGFIEWLFTPDMLFGAKVKWWGEGGSRTTPHEGIDLCCYHTAESGIRFIEPGTGIPAILSGTVIAVCNDYLGKSVFLKHHKYHKAGATLFTAYGHTKPESGIRPGAELSGGDIVGIVADTSRRRQAVPAHIHISAAWIPDTPPYQDINWETVSNPGSGIVLIDPLLLLELPYSLVRSLNNK